MTTWNVCLAFLMITEIIPVLYGMVLALLGMSVIVIITWKILMGDEFPWESRKKYKNRTGK